MRLFDVSSLDVAPHHPEILQSEAEGRTVAIALPAGESLQDHETHERTWLLVSSGELEIGHDGYSHTAGPGAVAIFDPRERRSVRAISDAKLVLVLAPWPGEGHPRTMSAEHRVPFDS